MAATIDNLLKEMQLLRQGQETGNDEAREQAKRERALLGQSEKQYEATLDQRKVTETSQKELQDLESILGGDAKNNKQYQKAQTKLEKEKAKLAKIEGRRNLLSRFKDTKGEKGTGAAVKELGGTALGGIGKTFKKIGGFLGQFSKIFSLLVIPALVLLVNSPVFGILKTKVKELIDWFGNDDNFLFGKNGVIKLLVDKFGALEVGIAAVLGFFTLKALGFAGLKAAFLGLKTAVVSIVTALGAPVIAVIAAIAAVGYALYDTFLEVKKKFDEGASVGVLIETAVVNFIGAFGKILDFVKDLAADVLGFFGASDETVAKIKGFSFEKIIEDFLTKAIEGIKSLFDFDFMAFIAGLLPKPGSGIIAKGLALAGVYESVGIDAKTGEPLEDPEVRAKRLVEEKAQEAKDKEVRKNVRGLEGQKVNFSVIRDKKRRIANLQRDVDDPDSNLFSKETKEEQAADLKKLQTEQKKLDELLKREAALDEQIKAAKAPPPNIVSAPTQINNSNPTSNNTSNSPSLKPSGSSGAMAAGAGSMVGGAAGL